MAGLQGCYCCITGRVQVRAPVALRVHPGHALEETVAWGVFTGSIQCWRHTQRSRCMQRLRDPEGYVWSVQACGI